ncbi:hypothetical protein HK405_010270 [Cladochytrium tenue]|nr:hypothetical protein HK405_010270 [Cladochytrium tenue]
MQVSDSQPADPFDIGDVEAGIEAHLAAGESIKDVVAFLVADRLSLRAQSEQMWKIIEKQRVIVSQLHEQLAKSSEEESSLRSALSIANGRVEFLEDESESQANLLQRARSNMEASEKGCQCDAGQRTTAASEECPRSP